MTQYQYILHTVDFKGDLDRSQLTHVVCILANFMYHKKVRYGHLLAVDACITSLVIHVILLVAQNIFMAEDHTYIRAQQSYFSDSLAGPPMKLGTSHNMWTTGVTNMLLVLLLYIDLHMISHKFTVFA